MTDFDDDLQSLADELDEEDNSQDELNNGDMESSNDAKASFRFKKPVSILSRRRKFPSLKFNSRRRMPNHNGRRRRWNWG